MGFSVDHAVLACISPSGSTARVMKIVGEALGDLGLRSDSFKIGRKAEEKAFLEITQAKGNHFIFLGSPVYVNQPLPPVMDLVSRMAENPDAVVIPFVTWGCVSSGLALHAMAEALCAKKFTVPAAFKVPARHSMMWEVSDPLGADRPNTIDEREIRSFILSTITRLLQDGPAGSLPLEGLLDQPANLIEEMKKASLNAAKAHFPEKKADESLCTQCGICVDGCPVEAISLMPFPVFADSCVWCYQCVRECPTHAIPMDLSGRVAMIRQRSRDLAEPAFVKFFPSRVDNPN